MKVRGVQTLVLATCVFVGGVSVLVALLVFPLLDGEPFLTEARSLVGADEERVRQHLGQPAMVVRIPSNEYPISGFESPPPIVAAYAWVYFSEKHAYYCFFNDDGRLIYVHRSGT
ncbi:MAG: hypothetical protein KatS3mg015_1057 [Fimbriimonadales bacterium]|nr:MAG: hypothetical protein KatS3mg015_1057 [Fimbriimonadales bacterium]